MKKQKASNDVWKLAEAKFGPRWYWPVIRELDRFEESTSFVSEFGSILDDDAPIWPGNCFEKVLTDMSDYSGWTSQFDKLDSRSIGKMVGSKWAIVEACARCHPLFKHFNAEQIEKIEKTWGKGFVAECVEFYAPYAEKHKKRFIRIKTKALALATNAGMFEEMRYLQGYVRGLEIWKYIRELMKRDPNKRLLDKQKRYCVYATAMLCGKEIEESKGELSWAEITDTVQEIAGPGVEFDEETVKKNLSREGLKGVGKAGRPSSKKSGQTK